jgi:hypothetical protein
MAVQPRRDLLVRRFAEDQLPVKEVAVHRQVAVDAYPSGIGAFVKHLEMGEWALGGWQGGVVVAGAVQLDSNCPQVGQVICGRV